MNILFSSHALERCKRRRINPQKLRLQVESVPRVNGVMEWTFPNNISVVINDTKAARVVITVKRKRKGRNRVKW